MSSIETEKEFKTTILSEPKTRRSAIKSIASGMTVAALSGCVNIRKPYRKIKAYNNDQENLIPGIPNYYATSTEINGDVNGLLVTSYEGRPTKIDGNPSHKRVAGKSNQFIQSEILSLYDPDRLTNNIDKKSNTLSYKKIEENLKNLKKDSSLALIVPNTYSYIDQQLISQIKIKYPNVNVFCLDYTISDNKLTAIKELTGNYGYQQNEFKSAKFVVSFNHDFLGLESSELRSGFHFIKNKNNFKFVSYSDSLTTSDSKADSIINSSIKEQEHTINYIAKSIARKLPNSSIKTQLKRLTYNKNLIDRTKAHKITQMLNRYRGNAIITAGDRHSVNTQKIIYLLNLALSNLNKTIFIKSFASKQFNITSYSNYLDTVSNLKDKLKNGSIKSVISLGVDLTRHINDLSQIINENTFITYLSKYRDNMSDLAEATISQTHFLEDWGLLLGKEGDLLIQQPLINPLYNGVSSSQVLLSILNQSLTPYNFLIKTLKKHTINFNLLKSEGVIHKFKRQRNLNIINTKLNIKNISDDNDKLKLSVVMSYTMLDGRYSNNSWLQESPDPISKLTWGNAFYLNSNYAKENQLKTGDVLSLDINSNTIKGPVIILPGQNKNTITIPFGYGNILKGAFSNYGINLDKFAPNAVYNIKSVKKLKETVTLADTQMNHGLDEEELAASGIKDRINKILKIQTVDELHSNKKHSTHEPHSLFKEQKYPGKYQWGMSIDLNSCLGCNACSIACQAENNIPIVGKEEVIRGREMSWLRIDRYFIENKNNETTINFMPLACVHCENAPCEQVCPVNATVHDEEGLNVMTYNRCVGTRYCANNCPYKVRRFNFFDWHQTNPQSTKKEKIHLFDYFREPAKQQQMQFNPEVTVRMRGVMEKCTYCIQKLKVAKINAKVKNDESYIKNIQTSCQQACTTNSIEFGNINDETRQVSKNRKNKRRYDLLQYELNTKPRTIYLSKIVNPLFKPSKKKEKINGYS